MLILTEELLSLILNSGSGERIIHGCGYGAGAELLQETVKGMCCG
jgi:ribose 5-phosphate isomerase RpiB